MNKVLVIFLYEKLRLFENENRLFLIDNLILQILFNWQPRVQWAEPVSTFRMELGNVWT